MARQQNALTVPVAHSIGAEIKFDKNDLVTVAVSKAERKMQDELKRLNASIKTHEKAIKDNGEQLVTAANKQAQEEFSEAAKAIATALDLLTKGHKAEVSGSYNQHRSNDPVCCHIEVSLKSERVFSATRNLKPNIEIRDTLSRSAEFEKQLASLRSEAVEWRRKLASLGTLERQFRARLVEAELNKSDLGKELLANLEGDWEQAVLELPGV